MSEQKFGLPSGLTLLVERSERSLMASLDERMRPLIDLIDQLRREKAELQAESAALRSDVQTLSRQLSEITELMKGIPDLYCLYQKHLSRQL